MFKIKCVEPADKEYLGFTKGKIYCVINGKIIDDDGLQRPLSSSLIHTLSDIENYSDYKNWEWIGRFEMCYDTNPFY